MSEAVVMALIQPVESWL